MLNNRLNLLVLSIAVGVLALAGLLYSAEIARAENQAAPVIPFVALLGDGPTVNSVAAPFIASGDLTSVREYPTPIDYIHESPTTISGLGQTPVIQMYQVTTDHVYVNNVISSVVTATLPHANVHPESGQMLWLSYVPKEVVIHGYCSGPDGVSEIYDTFQNDLNQQQLINLDYHGSAGAQAECIGRYLITSNKKVSEIVDSNGAVTTKARIEPNFLTGGTMPGYSTFGSPAAMLPNAPTTSTTGTSPIATTGNNVAIYLFDTSPYVNPGNFSRNIMTKAINVVNDGGVVLPASLPFRPTTTVASHGTFVATPVVDLAPDSNINLVRTLSNDAIGTEYAFVQAVDWAIKDALAPGFDYDGVIFNYSLGLEDKTDDIFKTAMERIVNVVNTLGVVQVAAAGNDSAYETMAMPTNLPAANANVFGVTALVPGNHIACYANQSRAGVGVGFAARGGGAARGVADCDVDEFVLACSMGAPGCLHGWDPNSPTKFAYGIGTSFAAPHVTGVAAQVIELIASAPRATQGWVKPGDVEAALQAEAVENGADMGDGYINGYTTAPLAAGLSSIAVSRSSVFLVAMLAMIAVLCSIFPMRGYNRGHE